MTRHEKIEKLQLLEEKNRRLLRRSLTEFSKEAWNIVEPETKYLHNWHIEAICDHLEAITNGDIRRLIINMPPRSMKTLLVSIFWPAWVWLTKPHIKWLCASYAQTLSTEHSLACRRIVSSDWYRNLIGNNNFYLTSDQNQKTRFENNRTGYRIATSVGAVSTGEGGDIIIADDPHKVNEVESEALRVRAIKWWTGEMSTRGNDPKKSAFVVVAQRVHESDLCGVLLEKGTYEHLCLPMKYEGDKKVTIIGWSDPRQEDEELLWPERFGPNEVKEIEKDLGQDRSAGQLQQRPAPKEGNIIKNYWWKYYKKIPDDLDIIIQSWDMTFKGDKTLKKKAIDYVVGQVWGKKGANKYLLDQVRAKLTFIETIKALKSLSSKWPETYKKLIEDKANGPAIIDTLKDEISGLIPVEPKGDKESRVNAVSPQIQSGNVYLPHPSKASWIDNFVNECSLFPNGKNDDQVDAMSQALFELREIKPPRVWSI